MTDHQALAAQEAVRWDNATDKRPGECPRNYIARTTGASTYHAEVRRTLYFMGQVAAPCWARINAGAPYATVLDAVRRGWPGRKLGTLTRLEVEQALELHDSQVAAMGGKRAKTKQAQSWHELREHLAHTVAAFSAAQCSDPAAAPYLARAVADLLVNVELAYTDYRRKVARASKLYTGALSTGPTSAAVWVACKELGLPCPPRGAPPDMAAAKAAKRAAARRYHPDITGNEASRPMLEAALAAYELLVAYAEQCTPTNGATTDVQRREEGQRHGH